LFTKVAVGVLQMNLLGKRAKIIAALNDGRNGGGSLDLSGLSGK